MGRKKCKECTIVEPTSSPIIVPSGVCDNGPGYVVDPTDYRNKKISCGLSKKKLEEFCPQEFFKAVCRKKCDQCASGEPSSTSAPKEPTKKPSKSPTKEPTKEPTKKPTKEPTQEPTKKPTKEPTKKPTKEPTKKPTKEPTKEPISSSMSMSTELFLLEA